MRHLEHFDFYSKIKDVFIEIHNYTFHHNPDEGSVENTRFIGRKKQLDRLETMLTRSDSKSGAYLITGYRGMGKTSLVNQVLAHIQRKPTDLPSIRRFSRWYLIVLLFLIYTNEYFSQNLITNLKWANLLLVLTPLMTLLFCVIIGCKPFLKNIQLNQYIKNALPVFIEFFNFKRTEKTNKTSYIILQDAVIIAFAFLCYEFLSYANIITQWGEIPMARKNLALIVGLIIISNIYKGRSKIQKVDNYLYPPENYKNGKKKIDSKLEELEAAIKSRRWWLMRFYTCLNIVTPLVLFFWNIPFYLVIGWAVSFIILVVMYIKLNNSVADIKKEKSIIEHGIYKWILNQINYGHYVPIRINAGQDDLKEIDILSLIAKTTYQTYKKWTTSIFFSFKQFLGAFLYYTTVIVATSVIFYYNSSYGVTSNWRYTSSFCHYFPSQAVLDNDGNKTLTQALMGYNNNPLNSVEKYLIATHYIVKDKKYLTYIATLDSSQKTLKKPFLELQAKHLEKNANRDTILLNFLLEAILQNSHRHDTNKILAIKNSIELYKDQFSIEKSTIDTQKLGYILVATDMFIQTTYNRFKKLFTEGVLPDRTLISFIVPRHKNTNQGFLPPFIDYLYILFAFFILLIVNILSRFSYIFGLRTPRYAINLLSDLVENIDAQILVEKTGQVPTMNTSGSRISWFSLRRQKSIPKLDAKAIENHLIHIMDEIDRIPDIVMKPRFIFIFDELDKIEPYYNPSVAAKEKEDVDNVRIEGSRMRQELVIKILGNLKHFLSTAKSKFIFIAGREMFDAALADTSDREAYISSIFSDVIEVPSFYSDDSDGRISDITSLTERFVCTYLIPQPLQNQYELSLKGYNRYLEEAIFEGTENNLKRHKIILILLNFITFLTYRSNGAPKKIAILFEKYVIIPEAHEINPTNNRNLIVRQYASDVFFKFDQYAQYRFGFTTYLFTPFLMNIGTHIYEMGDKLLVSTSFLLDHLYKFHPYGFSWRNLELTPEIIAINKSPHLREFMTNIINALSQNHIREILSGLHNFKFNQKIASEIRYISSISEPEAAAFNFTLDESLQIKRYYKKRLVDLKKNYMGKDLKDTQYVHTISFLYMILGDLHFYDQEYDDAILHYLDAVQLLRNSKGRDISIGNLVLLTRNILKLGLTFERKRSYESALTYYGHIDIIINSAREVLAEQLGLQEFILKKQDVKDFVKNYYFDIIDNAVFIKSLLDKIEYQTQLDNNLEEMGKRKALLENISPNSEECNQEIADVITKTIKENYFLDDNGNGTNTTLLSGRKVNPTTKDTINIKNEKFNILSGEKKQETSSSGYQNMKYFVGFSKDFFEYHLNNLPFNPEVQSVFYKSSLQEELRILYQPLIARLQILEKEGMQGITQIDLDRANREFQYLSKAFMKDQKYLLEAEFNNKIGDILFYKNGYLKQSQIVEDFRETKEQTDFAIVINEEQKDIFASDNTLNVKLFKPVSAYERYLKGCMLILKHGFGIKEFDSFLTKKNFLADGWAIERKIAQDIKHIWDKIQLDNNENKDKDEDKGKYLYNYSDTAISARSPK